MFCFSSLCASSAFSSSCGAGAAALRDLRSLQVQNDELVLLFGVGVVQRDNHVAAVIVQSEGESSLDFLDFLQLSRGENSGVFQLLLAGELREVLHTSGAGLGGSEIVDVRSEVDRHNVTSI